MTWRLIGCILVGSALLHAAVAEEPAKDIVAAVADYPKYRQMMAQRKSLGAEFAILCGVPPRALESRKKNGPHYGLYVQHFRNAIALEAGGAPHWPVGSILVKEKWGAQRGRGDKEEIRPAGITGMIKRAAGSRPASGDWEFFATHDGEIITTGMESCAGCHSGAGKDFVFTRFADRK